MKIDALQYSLSGADVAAAMSLLLPSVMLATVVGSPHVAAKQCSSAGLPNQHTSTCGICFRLTQARPLLLPCLLLLCDSTSKTSSCYKEALSMLTCRYAGAGLFDSMQSAEPQCRAADYSLDRLLVDSVYQHSMLVSIGIASMQIEQLMGSAQDIEGVIDCHDTLHIVQTRPQV